MRPSAFSLVELVIVIVIIGIIAAIAIPRVSQGHKSAKESALKQDLVTLRNAIDLYATEHGGNHPGSTDDGAGNAANSSGAFVSHMTRFSDAVGQAADVFSPATPLGPYLTRIPRAPVGAVAGSDTVAIDTSNSPPLVTAGDEGWVYNPATGEIIVNTDDANDAGTLTYDEY